MISLKTSLLAATGILASLAISPAKASPVCAGFINTCAPPSATIVAPPGSVDIAGAPASISLTSDDTGSGATSTTYTIDSNDFISSSPTYQVSFRWNYRTRDRDGPRWDPFGYLVNSGFFQLSNDGGPDAQSGNVNFTIVSGDTFGFDARSLDGLLRPATTTVSNFSVVPGPLPLLGAAAAFGYSRTLRKRIKVKRP